MLIKYSIMHKMNKYAYNTWITVGKVQNGRFEHLITYIDSVDDKLININLGARGEQFSKPSMPPNIADYYLKLLEIII